MRRLGDGFTPLDPENGAVAWHALWHCEGRGCVRKRLATRIVGPFTL
jgi:hypothetical protein